jgi:predicted RNase H-like nuclease (RuvC/YqgF family)
LKQLEQTNIQQGTLNLQLRQELNEKIVALDQSEIARRQMADRVRVLEQVKVTMEQQIKEISEVKVDIATQNRCKDELITELEEVAQAAKKEADNDRNEIKVMRERVKNFEVLVAKRTVDLETLQAKFDQA